MRSVGIFWLGFVLASCSGSSGTGGSGGSPATGGSTATGGSSATGGSGGQAGAAACSDFTSAYAAALKQAKVCDPSAQTPECTQQVSDRVDCPCAPTFVNPANTTALAALNAASQQWSDAKCYQDQGCTNVYCPPPTSGSCQADPSGTSGSCVDVH